jgi:hypothetical protein
MTTERKAVTVYLEPSLYEELKRCAVSEARSVSQLASFIIGENIGQFMGAPARKRLRDDGRQLDITDAIAAAVKRGPFKASKHK